MLYSDERGRLVRSVLQVEFQEIAGVYRIGSVFVSKKPTEKETLLLDRQTHDRGLLSLHKGQPQDWHPPATSVGSNRDSGATIADRQAHDRGHTSKDVWHPLSPSVETTASLDKSIGQDLGNVKTFKALADAEKRAKDSAIVKESMAKIRDSENDAELKQLTRQALIALDDSPDMAIPLVDENGNPAAISAAELIAREDARAAELEKTAKEGVTTAVACALINNGI